MGVVLEVAGEESRGASSALAEPLGVSGELISAHGISGERVANDFGVDIEPVGEGGDRLGRRRRLDDELERSIAERLSVGRSGVEGEDLAEVDILVANDSLTNIDWKRSVGAEDELAESVLLELPERLSARSDGPAQLGRGGANLVVLGGSSEEILHELRVIGLDCSAEEVVREETISVL